MAPPEGPSRCPWLGSLRGSLTRPPGGEVPQASPRGGAPLRRPLLPPAARRGRGGDPVTWRRKEGAGFPLARAAHAFTGRGREAEAEGRRRWMGARGRCVRGARGTGRGCARARRVAWRHVTSRHVGRENDPARAWRRRRRKGEVTWRSRAPPPPLCERTGQVPRARGARGAPLTRPRPGQRSPRAAAAPLSRPRGPAGPAPLCPPGGPSVRGSVGVRPGRPAPARPSTGWTGGRGFALLSVAATPGKLRPGLDRRPPPPPPAPSSPAQQGRGCGQRPPSWGRGARLARERWVLSAPPDIRGRGFCSASAFEERFSSHLGGAGLLQRGFPSGGLVPLARGHVRKAGPAAGVGPEGRWQLEKWTSGWWSIDLWLLPGFTSMLSCSPPFRVFPRWWWGSHLETITSQQLQWVSWGHDNEWTVPSMNLLQFSPSLPSAVFGCLELGATAGLTYVAFKNNRTLFCVFSCCWRKLQQGSELVGIPVQAAGCRKDLVHVWV